MSTSTHITYNRDSDKEGRLTPRVDPQVRLTQGEAYDHIVTGQVRPASLNICEFSYLNRDDFTTSPHFQDAEVSDNYCPEHYPTHYLWRRNKLLYPLVGVPVLISFVLSLPFKDTIQNLIKTTA